MTAAAHADPFETTFQDTVTFDSAGQNLFGGSAPSITIPGEQFDVPPTNISLGGFVLGIGGEISLSTQDTIGTQYTITPNSGSLDSSVQGQFTVTAPLGILDAGSNFSVSLSPDSGITGGTFSVQAPSVTLAMQGIIDFQNSVSAEGCITALECGSVSQALNYEPGPISLLSVNTGTGDMTFLSSLTLPSPGFEFPFNIKVGPGLLPVVGNVGVTVAQVQLSKGVNQTFTTTPDIFGLQFSTAPPPGNLPPPVISVSASIPGIVQLAGSGLPIGILQNNLAIPGILNLGYTLFDAEAGVKLGLEQDFTFNATPEAHLTFSTGVSETTTVYHWQECGIFGCGGLLGGPPFFFDTLTPTPTGCGLFSTCTLIGTSTTSVDIPSGTVDLVAGQTLNLSLDGPGQLNNVTYSLSNPTLNNSTFLEFDPFLNFTALCGELSVIDVYDSGNSCLYQNELDFGNGEVALPNDFFALGGFSGVSSPANLYIGVSNSDLGLQAVPEPASFLCFGTGLVLLALFARRRQLWMRKRSLGL